MLHAQQLVLKPKHVWNRVPTEVKSKVVRLALQKTELAPRVLAVTFTDQERYFVSESTVYRTLKAHDLITSTAFIVFKAANEFKDKTTAINQLWQTGFTYIKVLGWARLYLSTVPDDNSRRRLLRARQSHSETTRKDQTKDA